MKPSEEGGRYCGACGKAEQPGEPIEVVESETWEHGRLWPDGTFQKLNAYGEKHARKEFEEQSYDLRNVPVSLRPVLGRQLTKTRKEIFKAEAVPAEKKQ